MKVSYKMKICVYITFILGFIIHGYRFMNLNITHDSLSSFNIYEYPQAVISIGRFLYYFYYVLFPSYSEPFFCGVVSLVFLSIGNFCLCSFLCLNKVQTFIVCALMTVSIPFTLFSATYINSLPLFSLSFALCCLGVYFIGINKRKYFFLGGICLAFSMGGEDQSIIQFAGMLFFVKVLTNTFSDDCFRLKVFQICKFFFCIIFSGAFYYIIYKFSLLCFGIQPNPDDYNSLERMNLENYLIKLSDKTFIVNLIKLPFHFFYHSSSSDYALPHNILVNISVFFSYVIIVLYPLTFIKKYFKKSLLFIYYVLITLSPFVINWVYFISNGIMHDLMKLSYYFPFLFCVCCVGNMIDNIKKSKFAFFIKNINYLNILYLPIFVIVFSTSIFAKNAYAIKEQQFILIQQTINRIVYGIENTKSYVPNKTKVIFIGKLDNNSNINRNLKKSLYTGLNYISTYNGPFYSYLFNFLGCNIKAVAYLREFNDIFKFDFVSKDIVLNSSDIKKLESAPIFPQNGYITNINGVLFVKISE